MNKVLFQIKLFPKVGSFAEDKDIAREIRLNEITPLLKKNEEVILDFDKIDSTTQSFIHALISEVIREFGSDVLDKISFKNCNENVQKIINIVVEYMQL
ncbi:STAS-like domain-containing protein [Candidatus Daviesbacteria bacterium]|nr:STAS-like domain-containing protein [Candidatus Daviesbacteria bacterium]